MMITPFHFHLHYQELSIQVVHFKLELGCQLFPFNLFGRLGDHLVVAPNGLCPLEITGNGISHAHITRTMQQHPIHWEVPNIRPELGSRLLPLEQALLQACALLVHDADLLLLVSVMHTATQAWFSNQVSVELDLSAIERASIAHAELLDDYIRVLGIALPNKTSLDTVATLITAWAPTIRLFGLDDLPLEKVPHAFLALGLLCAYWQSLRPDRAVKPQTMLQIISSLKPLIYLLAHWTWPWQGPAVEDLGLKTGMPLGKALQKQLEIQSDLQRIPWLHRLSHRLGLVA